MKLRRTRSRPLFPGRTMLYVREVAGHLQITRQHVIHLIEDGSLDAVNIHTSGGRNCWRIPVEGYKTFLKKRGAGV